VIDTIEQSCKSGPYDYSPDAFIDGEITSAPREIGDELGDQR